MNFIKPFLVAILLVACTTVSGQISFEELEFEADSLTTPFKPDSKNYVFIRSKRGNTGVNRSPAANAITSSDVLEIVLVFTEKDASDIGEREAANRERWENLMLSYPEYFQYSTTYRNVCQCHIKGDLETFKKVQGFYVFVDGEVPAVNSEPEEEETPVVAKTGNVVASPTAVQPEKQEAPKTEPVVENRKEEVAAADKTATKEVVVKETEELVTEDKQEEAEAPKPQAKAAVKKKTDLTKPRRAKSSKACRPPCYGYGDDDLYNFFKDNITLTKKQKRKAKSWVANVRLQINHDGSIKKVMVSGSDRDFNGILEEALKSMNNWNCAVKAGVAVKSEVRFVVKYDKASKAMKPFDLNMNPRPTPKCQCASDSEIFGD